MKVWLSGLVLLALLAAGCAPQPGASDAVQAYLQALVNKDRDRFVKLFCASFEADALTEFDSFGAVEASLDNVACQTAGTEDGYTLVTCSGSIAVTYRGEDNQMLALDGTTYRAVQQGGDWKVCGYQ